MMGVCIARTFGQHLLIAFMGLCEMSWTRILVVGSESVLAFIQQSLRTAPLGFGIRWIGETGFVFFGLLAEDREDGLLLVLGDVFRFCFGREPAQTGARLATTRHEQSPDNQRPMRSTARTHGTHSRGSMRSCAESELGTREDFRDQRGSLHRGLRDHVCTQLGKKFALTGFHILSPRHPGAQWILLRRNRSKIHALHGHTQPSL